MTARTLTNLIVVHCSATKPDADIGATQIREWHLAKGWADIGYHFVIRRGGEVELGRALTEIGAHVEGHNSHTVGVCMVGGLTAAGKGFDDDPKQFTPQQWASARVLLRFLRTVYPQASICGHRDLSPDKDGDGKITRGEWLKTCPGFHAAKEFSDV